MSKVISLRLSDDVYERLMDSSEKMGLMKAGYITYSLKQTFEKEDFMSQMPGIMEKLENIQKEIEKNNKDK